MEGRLGRCSSTTLDNARQRSTTLDTFGPSQLADPCQHTPARRPPAKTSCLQTPPAGLHKSAWAPWVALLAWDAGFCFSGHLDPPAPVVGYDVALDVASAMLPPVFRTSSAAAARVCVRRHAVPLCQPPTPRPPSATPHNALGCLRCAMLGSGRAVVRAISSRDGGVLLLVPPVSRHLPCPLFHFHEERPTTTNASLRRAGSGQTEDEHCALWSIWEGPRIVQGEQQNPKHLSLSLPPGDGPRTRHDKYGACLLLSVLIGPAAGAGNLFLVQATPNVERADARKARK